MKKRILSMLLVIVMVLSLVPVSALADGITISGKNLRVIAKIIQFENLTEKSFAFIKVDRQIID